MNITNQLPKEHQPCITNSPKRYHRKQANNLNSLFAQWSFVLICNRERAQCIIYGLVRMVWPFARNKWIMIICGERFIQSECGLKQASDTHQVALERTGETECPINSINCYTCSIVKRFSSISNQNSYIIRCSAACTCTTTTATTTQIIYQFPIHSFEKASDWSLCDAQVVRHQLCQTTWPNVC